MGRNGGGPLSNVKPLRLPGEIGGKRFRISGYDQYVPARRRRARRRRWAALGLIVAAVLATGGWYGYNNVWHTSNGSHVAGGCQPGTSVSVAASTPAKGRSGAAAGGTASTKQQLVALKPGQITVNVLNSTQISHLAAMTANTLKQRGFAIGNVGDSSMNIPGPAIVQGSAAELAKMQYLGAQIDGTQQQVTKTGGPALTLILGNGFNGLRDQTQVNIALQSLAAADAASTPAPTCHA
jgi:hypothetical protein